MSEDLENVDQPDEAPVTGRRLSRRTMIAGTAGAAAVMWAEPAVTSVGARAFANGAATSPAPCQGVPDISCIPAQNTVCGSVAAGDCMCLQGQCWYQTAFQSGCASDADCELVVDLQPHCVPVCATTYCLLTCAQASTLNA